MSKEFPTNEVIIEGIIETIIGITTEVLGTSGMIGITEGVITPTEDLPLFPAAGIITTDRSEIRIS